MRIQYFIISNDQANFEKLKNRKERFNLENKTGESRNNITISKRRKKKIFIKKTNIKTRIKFGVRKNKRNFNTKKRFRFNKYN